MDEARIRAARQGSPNRHPENREPEKEPEKPVEREYRTVSHYSNSRRDSDNSSKMKKLIVPVVTLVIVVLAGIGGWMVWSTFGAGTGIDGSKYQAVFFTNGQVYFGKLHTMNNDYMRLTDIFYLQRKASDTTDDKNLQKGSNESDLNNVELVKLGQELHGPQDEMVINKDQILFYENLKENGKVASTISTYKP